MGALYRKIAGLPRDFILFILAIALIGFSQSAINSVFNNYLNEIFHISNNQRGMLELPREMPGFLVVVLWGGLFLM
jgi:hypothetical protein